MGSFEVEGLILTSRLEQGDTKDTSGSGTSGLGYLRTGRGRLGGRGREVSDVVPTSIPVSFYMRPEGVCGGGSCRSRPTGWGWVTVPPPGTTPDLGDHRDGTGRESPWSVWSLSYLVGVPRGLVGLGPSLPVFTRRREEVKGGGREGPGEGQGTIGSE